MKLRGIKQELIGKTNSSNLRFLKMHVTVSVSVLL